MTIEGIEWPEHVAYDVIKAEVLREAAEKIKDAADNEEDDYVYSGLMMAAELISPWSEDDVSEL